MDEPVSERAEPHPWGLAAFWFSLNFQGSALLTIVLPATLSAIARTNRTAELARLVALAAVLSMAVPPVAGFVSDRLRRRGLRRRSFVLVGTTLNVAGLLWAMHAQSVLALAAGILVSVFGQHTATVAYQAMMPEVVDPRRWGEASGYMGVASLAGSVGGLATAGILPLPAVYGAMMAVSAGGAAVTALAVHESRTMRPDPRPRAHIRSFRAFAWVFASRFFILMAQSMLMTFALYFFQDVLHASSPQGGTALVAGLALVGAAASAFYVGRASDRLDRTRVVALSGLPMALAVAGFGLFPDPSFVFALAVVWGLGYGAFLSVDWALGLDSIPDLANVARDLGIWGIASNLPSVAAPIVGGWILGRYLPAAFGYRVLFMTAAASFLLGSLLVLAGRQSARIERAVRFALTYLVASLLWVYVSLAYRVRVTGRLPQSADGLLVLGNHLHDLEGMVIPVRLLFIGGARGKVHAVASLRVMEPGFLATRAPWWLGRWLAPVNVGGVLALLGVLPIENMPLARPLSSWAYVVFRMDGDLPLADVFTDEALTAQGIAPKGNLSRLWAVGTRPQSGPLVTLRVLRTPYRERVRARVRREIEQQMDTLVATLRRGDVLYLTPEGRMSSTGRAGRFRAVFDTLLPHARQVWLAATAFDPWSYRRLSMSVHLTRPEDPDDLVNSLKAARPITLSQIVAAQIRSGSGGVPTHPLRAAGRAELAGPLRDRVQLPRGWQLALPIALRRMQRRGIIRRRGRQWEAGAQRYDPRFGHVPDLLAAQAEQYRETVEARRALDARRAQAASPFGRYGGTGGRA